MCIRDRSWVERAREYVLTRTVPPTDAECDFSWSRLRCEPKCLCGARLRFGDYTPGRTCRLLHHWERSPECEAAWDPSDEPAVRRLAATLAWGLSSAKQAYEARVAPPSDPECVFDFQTRRCQPQSMCRLKFKVSVLTISFTGSRVTQGVYFISAFIRDSFFLSSERLKILQMAACTSTADDVSFSR